MQAKKKTESKTGLVERVYEGWNAAKHKKIKRARVICKFRQCINNEYSLNTCTAPKIVIENGTCYGFEKSRQL